jgi:uncharacterized protein involved in exopolysaccharide biosynthesis
MDGLTNSRNGNNVALSFTLRDALAPVFRHRRMASLIFLGVFIGAVVSLLAAPKKYEAEMKILVNRDRVDAVVTPDPGAPVAVQSAGDVTDEDLNSEVELLKGRDLLEEVVRATGLATPNDSKWTRATNWIGDTLRGTQSTQETRIARSVQTLSDQLAVEPLKKTTLIRVSYEAHDPEQSARVLNTLATLYQEKHAAVHRPAGTFAFFDQEATRYRDELRTAEAHLTEFDSKGGIVEPATQKQLVLQQISQFQTESQQDRANAYAARERAAMLQSEAAGTPERETTQMQKLDNGQLLAELQSTLLSLELKKSELNLKYVPSYPLVQEVLAQIAQTREAIAQAQQSPVEEVTTDRVPAREWIATELAKARADDATLEAEATAKDRVVQSYQESAQQLNQKGGVQADLIRNVKTSEDNYLLYLRKREEARISDALDSKRIVNVTIAEAATVPALPSLHLGWVLIGGFALAGTLSIGSAYAVDRIDRSFRTPDELGRYLDVRVLASIPESAEQR